MKNWLEELGLERVDGLLEALLSVADGLPKLGELSESQLNAATAELYLRGVKARKLHAAVAALKSEHESAFLPKRNTELAWRDGALERPLEAPLDIASSVTHLTMADMPPPPRPRIGDLRMPANANPPRFMPRTMAEISAVPSEPEEAAISLGLTGPSEAREISELAELFGAGALSSGSGRNGSARSRPTHGLAARAAASAASAAAAAAMEAAAKASEKVVAAAAAHAKRREVGLNDDITPRSRESVDMLALDLREALDEASAQAKAAAQEEMTKAIAKELGSALTKEVNNVLDAHKKKLKKKKLGATSVAGGGVHGFKMNGVQNLSLNLGEVKPGEAKAAEEQAEGAEAAAGGSVSARTRQAGKKKKAAATAAPAPSGNGADTPRTARADTPRTSRAEEKPKAAARAEEKAKATAARAGEKEVKKAGSKKVKSKFVPPVVDKENAAPNSARQTRNGGMSFNL